MSEPGPTDEPIDYDELDRTDELERERTRALAQEKIAVVMDNTDGLARIEAITDDEWNKAQAMDDEIERATLTVSRPAGWGDTESA